MKRFSKKFFLALFLILTVISLNASTRLDLAVDVPLYFGINYEGDSMGALSDYTFLIPEVGFHYMLETGGSMNVGVGVRGLTLIVETLLLPNIMFELEMDPLVFTAQVGGGAVIMFGLYNNVQTAPLMVGDLAAGYRLSDFFQAGVGVLMIGETDPEIDLSESGVVPYSIYAFGKFSFNF